MGRRTSQFARNTDNTRARTCVFFSCLTIRRSIMDNPGVLAVATRFFGKSNPDANFRRLRDFLEAASILAPFTSPSTVTRTPSARSNSSNGNFRPLTLSQSPRGASLYHSIRSFFALQGLGRNDCSLRAQSSHR